MGLGLTFITEVLETPSAINFKFRNLTPRPEILLLEIFKTTVLVRLFNEKVPPSI